MLGVSVFIAMLGVSVFNAMFGVSVFIASPRAKPIAGGVQICIIKHTVNNYTIIVP
jgi:hypothetical protein